MFCGIDSPVHIARKEGKNEGIVWQKEQSQARIDRMASGVKRMASTMEQMTAEIAALKAFPSRSSK